MAMSTMLAALLLAAATAPQRPHGEPPGSGWAAQLSRTHPSHPFTLLQRTGTPGLTPAVASHPAACPDPAWAAAVEPAGLLSVKLFGAKGDGTDDAPAVRLAINASAMCGGCVFFPPGEYFFNSTVQIQKGCFKGSMGGGQVDGSSPPMVNIRGPAQGPVIALLHADSVLIQDLAFHGIYTGIYVGSSAGVRLVNVGAEVFTI